MKVFPQHFGFKGGVLCFFALSAGRLRIQRPPQSGSPALQKMRRGRIPPQDWLCPHNLPGVLPPRRMHTANTRTVEPRHGELRGHVVVVEVVAVDHKRLGGAAKVAGGVEAMQGRDPGFILGG